MPADICLLNHLKPKPFVFFFPAVHTRRSWIFQVPPKRRWERWPWTDSRYPPPLSKKKKKTSGHVWQKKIIKNLLTKKVLINCHGNLPWLITVDWWGIWGSPREKKGKRGCFKVGLWGKLLGGFVRYGKGSFCILTKGLTVFPRSNYNQLWRQLVISGLTVMSLALPGKRRFRWQSFKGREHSYE